jgi:cellulose synthase (UDP-forming)
VYSWIVFGAEILAFARVLMFLLSAVRLTHREPPVAPGGLSVDLFVTTLDEPAGIVRRTLMAALAIRYPHETWLLDDGERTEMRSLAEELGCRYVARTEHGDAKAGNLNHALGLARGAFVAVFDADHVADPRFLERTLGYFQDERVAFVQTPQEFFNTDSFEHITKRTTLNCSSFFHGIVQRCRDASETTMFTGSSAVLRRRALDEISGFATGTISEDIHTSFRLHAAGWRSRFQAEILSAGLAPHDAAAFRGQRLRWAQDALQLVQRENVAAHPAYLIHVISNVEGWRHIFIYALPIVILVTGIAPLQTGALPFLAYFTPYFLALTLACTEMARGHLRFSESTVYNLARCPTSICATFTAQWEWRFRVTPKTPAQRHSLTGSTFASALLLANVVAIAYACGLALAGRSPLAMGTLAVVGAWAAFHALTAARLLMLERRCAKERRATTRFDENIPVTFTDVRDPHAHYAVDIVNATADGFGWRVRNGTIGPPPGIYAGLLDLAGERFSFEITVSGAHRGGSVCWAGARARAAVDLQLHLRAIERFAAADHGDRGGVFHPAGIKRRALRARDALGVTAATLEAG